MEPNSFTKTSFCGVSIDNITTNETKKYILDHLNVMCNGMKFNKRYAKVYNEQYSKNLKNPHVFFLKTSGTPYLLFLTQINGTNYSFLIDKKTNDKYEYPKILIVPYNFDIELYKGTLLECELIRNKSQEWSLAINDIYYNCGKNMNKTSIIDRINIIYKILDNKYSENSYSETCPLFVKRYFDYKEISFVKDEFIPNLPYNIRGIYFIPLRVDYSNILYLFPRENVKKNTAVSNSNKVFRVMKTMKTDVYELYLKDGDNLVKKGIALIQDTELSHKILSYFEEKNNTDEVKIECKYNKDFDKWIPITLSNKEITDVNL
tara:strand:- start:8 stop:964 length:957 start_codon:yes stop_codon:yes gene_type:complete